MSKTTITISPTEKFALNPRRHPNGFRVWEGTMADGSSIQAYIACIGLPLDFVPPNDLLELELESAPNIINFQVVVKTL